MWPFECREISTFREVWTVVIPFLERNSKIGLRQAVDQVPYYQVNRQFWAPRESGGGDRPRNVQLWAIVGSSMVRDLDLDLGSGQGHINIHSTCRTTSTPKHVTVASRSAEIRPFEFREISTIGDVWTIVIAFLWGNSKIGLRQAVDQVPYYDNQPSVLSYARKWRRR